MRIDCGGPSPFHILTPYLNPNIFKLLQGFGSDSGLQVNIQYINLRH